MSFAEPPLPVPDDDALDAAASAVVDGVASPAEAALVAASPEGEARVAMLRAVADAVALPVPDQDEAARARTLAAALAAFAATTGTGDGADGPDLGDRGGRDDDGPGTVRTLPPRPTSAVTGRWLPRLGAVAAVLVLLAGIGALAVGLLGDTARDTTMGSKAPGVASEATQPAPPPGASEDSAAGRAGPAGPGPAPEGRPIPGRTAETAMAAAPPPVVDGGDLGNQSDLQALVQRVAAALDNEADPATAGRGTALPTDVQACIAAGPTAANQPVGPLRYRAVGTFQGTPAVVAAYGESGAQPRLLLVLARPGCTVVASTPF
ncbi:MAG: hypothetical protein AVDCRST_MAG76-2455 [uncultured Acidimicrobiales bacterium]|uniref:Uncharacterized protein n=1 Tax=uncultured Acidimicrobiales bacterium TaxID=310071 RepID=A0A6J4IJM0_9ACTN|nr:MAG: hypothetical protein AVDCRST_MAG76-2455 [uncultured Acidimicrobiales bacterium]